jgi:hypothetical protein
MRPRRRARADFLPWSILPGPALDRPAAAHHDEAAPVALGAPLEREDAAKTGRVEEVEAAQVEHDAARLRGLEAAHLLVEGVGPAEVELAAQGDTDGVQGETFDGDPQRLVHAVHSFSVTPDPAFGVSTPISAP